MEDNNELVKQLVADTGTEWSRLMLTLATYKKAYREALAENEALKTQLAEANEAVKRLTNEEGSGIDDTTHSGTGRNEGGDPGTPISGNTGRPRPHTHSKAGQRRTKL